MGNNGKNSKVRIGVYVCHCGTNISATVNIKQLIDVTAKLANVVIAREYKYMCSEPGQDMIKKDPVVQELVVGGFIFELNGQAPGFTR